jgi:hypothetical protein
MDGYFEYVVESLNVQDIDLLRILSNNGATVKFKAILHTIVIEKIGLSDAKYRTVITRLTAMKFVEVNSGSKESVK